MIEKQLRVVHIITRLILGGAQENTLLSVEGLGKKPEYDVLLITGPAIGPEGELIKRARRNGVNLIILPEMRREINLPRDLITLRKLYSLLKKTKPHIVHTHSSKAGILGRLAARLANAPVVIHTIHGMPFHQYEKWALNKVYIFLEKIAARWSDKIVTVADAMIEQAVAAGVAEKEKFQTIYSGMEVEPFLAADESRSEVRARLGVSEDEIVIGKIARLFELKGHEYVLRAAPRILEQFPNVKFLFVGDGILREELKREADELGIGGKIIFAGLVDPSEIPKMIKAMDLVVHASLREGLARVLPQSLISGRPVISYDIDGAREVVIDGETGFLVQPEAVDELADAVIRVLTDMDRAREMAAKGREMFTERFRAETMVAEIDALYKSLLSRC